MKSMHQKNNRKQRPKNVKDNHYMSSIRNFQVEPEESLNFFELELKTSLFLRHTTSRLLIRRNEYFPSVQFIIRCLFFLACLVIRWTLFAIEKYTFHNKTSVRTLFFTPYFRLWFHPETTRYRTKKIYEQKEKNKKMCN